MGQNLPLNWSLMKIYGAMSRAKDEWKLLMTDHNIYDYLSWVLTISSSIPKSMQLSSRHINNVAKGLKSTCTIP